MTRAAGAVAAPSPADERLQPGLATKVIAWQRTHGRHGLPWQHTRNPYHVWLSEVMLQQTQVSVVLDYYPRFLQRFPTVQALAAAPQDDVLALWSGLGYYSRARNLHRCAQSVVAEHGGAFPRSSAGLASLPGIGRSTAAAIAAFCFGERAAILDGNVKRVLTRALGFGGDLASSAEEKRLWATAEALLPATDVDVYTQGLMDLGATVCLLRRPVCAACPLAADCVGRASGAPQQYPVKTRKLKRGSREHALLWLQQAGRVYLVQRPQTGVWAGLWSLPEYPADDSLDALAANWPGHGGWLTPIQHALTHFDWTLHTLAWTLPAGAALPAALSAALNAERSADVQAGRWYSVQQALALGLATPVRKLLQQSADDDLFVAQEAVHQ